MTDGGPHQYKPDPEEPWRYACPECGSASVKHQHTIATDERRFQCGRCHWYGPEPELVDRQSDNSHGGAALGWEPTDDDRG